MKSLELKVSTSSLKLCLVVFFMSLFNMAIVILSLLAILRFRIIIRRKIIRQNRGYIEEFDQMSLKDSEEKVEEQQEIEMKILNSRERDIEINNQNQQNYSQYENVNNQIENDISHKQNNMNDIVVNKNDQ